MLITPLPLKIQLTPQALNLKITTVSVNIQLILLVKLDMRTGYVQCCECAAFEFICCKDVYDIIHTSKRLGKIKILNHLFGKFFSHTIQQVSTEPVYIECVIDSLTVRQNQTYMADLELLIT